jgi:hypothetical protein
VCCKMNLSLLPQHQRANGDAECSCYLTTNLTFSTLVDQRAKSSLWLTFMTSKCTSSSTSDRVERGTKHLWAKETVLKSLKTCEQTGMISNKNVTHECAVEGNDIKFGRCI